ncbi:hypothetical protein X975_15329, partial [Stegodyphus mimosarum]
MLAQSRKLEQELLAEDGVRSNSVPDVMQNPEFHREQDFQEVARWLQDKPAEADDAATEPNTG